MTESVVKLEKHGRQWTEERQRKNHSPSGLSFHLQNGAITIQPLRKLGRGALTLFFNA